ncbi:MAG: hypothetical protein KKC46_16765 [Proteobacteria bacterium]|nr:hypothetical protein [Pseudomonadota bacterium]
MNIITFRSKVIILALFSLFSLPLFPLPSEALNVYGLKGLKTDVESKVYDISISGNENQSILQNGTFYSSDFTIANREKILNGCDFEWLINFRNTDDPLVDEKDTHLLKFYTKIGKPKLFRVEFGDIYSNFSRYSLTSNLEGLQGSYQFNFSPSYYIKPLFVISRSKRAISSEHYARYVMGGRLEAGSVNKGAVIGLNFSKNWDDTGSIDNDDLPAGNNFSPDENYVYSINAKFQKNSLWKIKRIAVDAEAATSRFNDDKDDSSVSTRNDWAFRSSIIGTLINGLRFDVGYEKVQPDFHTNAGSAPVDQQLFRTNLNYNIYNWLQLRGGYKTYRNNLKGQLENTQRSYMPHLSVTLLPTKELSLEFLYRYNYIDSATHDPRNYRNTYTATGRYSLKKVYMSITGEYEEFENKADKTTDSKRDMVSLSAGLREMGLGWQIKLWPSLTYSLCRDKYTYSNDTDIFNHLRFNTRLDYNRFLIFNGGLSIADNNRAATSSDSSKVGWFFELTAQPENRFGIDFNIKYEDRDNRHDDSNREYREKIGTASCRFKF